MHQTNEQSLSRKDGSQESFTDATFTRDTIALSSIDLSSVTEKIKAHNESIGVGPTLGRLLIGLFRQVKDVPRNEVDPKAALYKALGDEDARRASMQASFEAEIAPTLGAVGLKICPVSKGWSIFGPDTNFQSVRLAFYIDEPGHFRQYLESLNTETITPTQRRGLTTFLQSLCDQIRKDYDATRGDDRLLALVSAAESISSNYERLGLVSNRFNKYVEGIRGRYLRDLINAELLELDRPFNPQSGFPLKWHRDCVPATLESKWGQVLDVLVALANNPHASELYAQANETAKAANHSAIQEVLTWSSQSSPSYQANRDEFLKILRRAELRLTEF